MSKISNPELWKLVENGMKGNDMTNHELKIIEPYFTLVKDEVKTFEVMKNDRDFKVGDHLKLVLIQDGKKTPFYLMRKITYILDSPEYCKDGYVVFAISKL